MCTSSMLLCVLRTVRDGGRGGGWGGIQFGFLCVFFKGGVLHLYIFIFIF